MLVSVAYSFGQVNNFSATSSGNNVIITWTSGDETGIAHYSILRKTPQTSNVEITQIQPKGNNSSYYYEDQSLYKILDMVFTYQIEITYNNGRKPDFSTTWSVSPNISGIKRTWGSIKAMFR